MRWLLTFFVLVFAASWSLFFAAGDLWSRAASGAAGLAGVGTILYLVGVFTPALAALVLARVAEGPSGARSLIFQIGKLPSAARWYVFAIGFLAAIKLIAAILHRAIFGAWPAFGPEPIYLMLLATLVSTPMQAGEEIGWRGYALPRLAALVGLGPASLLIGIIWAAWHLPFFFFASDKYGQSFPMYALGAIALSVVMAWLYWRTNGSLLMTMLMHAAVNNTKDIVPSAAAVAGNPWSLRAWPVAWLTTALIWISAAYFLIRMRGARLDEAVFRPTSNQGALEGARPDHSDPSAINRSK